MLLQDHDNIVDIIREQLDEADFNQEFYATYRLMYTLPSVVRPPSNLFQPYQFSLASRELAM
jgi:hypothetical protein